MGGWVDYIIDWLIVIYRGLIWFISDVIVLYYGFFVFWGIYVSIFYVGKFF